MKEIVDYDNYTHLNKININLNYVQHQIMSHEINWNHELNFKAIHNPSTVLALQILSSIFYRALHHDQVKNILVRD